MPDPFDNAALSALVGDQTADQYAESMKRLAVPIAVYHRELLARGVPAQLAFYLTLDYHWLFVGSMFFKDGNFPPRGGVPGA